MHKQAAAVATRQAEELQGRLAAANDAIKVGRGLYRRTPCLAHPRGQRYRHLYQVERNQTSLSRFNQ